MEHMPFISMIIALPLIGALILIIIDAAEDDGGVGARSIGLLTSAFNLLLTLWMLYEFDTSVLEFQFAEVYPWLDDTIAYRVGVDALSMSLIVLTVFLVPVCLLVSWSSVKKNVNRYVALFLALESMIIGAFAATDLVLFYLFFEAILIPMFIVIGVWGGPRRIYASIKFFLFTFLGSVLLLLAVMYMVTTAGTADVAKLMDYEFSQSAQLALWLAFFASLAVKTPMWPVHTWLPDAHVEAPTAGSVLLAGILLKLGGFAFLRYSLPMMPYASAYFADLVYVLSVASIIFGSLAALAQTDMKKLIAYSSVAHMGFVTLGIFSFTRQGIDGAVFQMISHGIISSALFISVGVLYDRTHSREIADYGGVVTPMPKFARYLMLFTMANVGLPGTSGFIGEFLSLLGIFTVSQIVAALAATGVVLSAAYGLRLYRDVIFGRVSREEVARLQDVTTRENAILLVMAVITIGLGVYPSILTDFTSGWSEDLTRYIGFSVGAF